MHKKININANHIGLPCTRTWYVPVHKYELIYHLTEVIVDECVGINRLFQNYEYRCSSLLKVT